MEEGKSRTIRVNAETGPLVIETELDDWTRPGEDDLAVVMIPCPEQMVLNYIREDQFITPAIVESLKVGPGDEVFMVGRFGGTKGIRRTPQRLDSGTSR